MAKKKMVFWPRESRKGTERTNAITDGIFAFAMTLLVLTVVIPEVPHNLVEWQYDEVLLGLTPALYTLPSASWCSPHSGSSITTFMTM